MNRDLLKVQELTKDSNEIIDIHYLEIITETENFAKEIKAELSKYYEEVNLKPNYNPIVTIGERFAIIRHKKDNHVIVEVLYPYP